MLTIDCTHSGTEKVDLYQNMTMVMIIIVHHEQNNLHCRSINDSKSQKN